MNSFNSYPKCSIKLLEKEKEVSMHTSGRNSGVNHAGFYYSSETLKAQFCRRGNEMWTQYCDEHKLPIRKCGKLVVPKVFNLFLRVNCCPLERERGGVLERLVPTRLEEQGPN